MATKKGSSRKGDGSNTEPRDDDKNNQVEVRSERAAFALLNRALNDEFDGKNINIELKGWPVLEFSLSGKGYSSTITADVADTISGIQRAVNRAYALTIKNQASAIHLTNAEKNSVRFKAKVSKGSSLVSIDLGPAGQAIANNLVGKMTSSEIIVTVLGLGAIWGASAVFKQAIKSRAENRNVSEQTQNSLMMSQEETKKIATVADAITRVASLNHAKADFNEIGLDLLKSVGDADQIQVNGVAVDQKSAYELSRGTRAASKAIQLNGEYSVSEASFKQDDATKISIRNTADGREFTASFQDDSLEQGQLAVLKDAAFERKPVFLVINGTELRGQITTAAILEVRLAAP